MPIIPRNNEAVQIQPRNPVPIAGTGDARILGESMAKAGGVFIGLGEQLRTEEKKQEEFARQNNVNEAKNDLQNVYKSAADYASRVSKSDGSDLAKNFYDKAGPEADKIMGSYAENPKTYQEVQSFGKMLKSDFDTHLTIEGSKMLEKDNYKRLEDGADISADRVRAQPDEKLVAAESMSFGNQINDLVSKQIISPANATKIRGVHDEKVALAYVDGLGNNRQYGKALNALTANQEDPSLFTEMPPEQAQKLGFIDPTEAKALASKGELYKVPAMTKNSEVVMNPQLAAVMNGLSSEKKGALIDHYKSKVREDSDMRLSDLNAQVSGFEKIAHGGGNYGEQQVIDLKNNVNNNATLTLYAKRRALDAIDTADSVNKQLKLAVSTPRSQWGGVVEGLDKRLSEGNASAAKMDPRMVGLDGDLAVQANRMESKQILANSLKRMAEQDDKDPVAFNIQNDPALEVLYKGSKDNTPEGKTATNKFIVNSLAKQAYRGVPTDKQRVLTNDEVSQISNMIKAAPDSGTANAALNSLQDKFGDYFPRVMKEVANKDKELKAYGAAVYADPQNRGDLTDAIKNRVSIEENLKKQPGWDSQKKLIDASVQTNMSEFRRAMSMSGNGTESEAVSGNFDAAIALQVKRNLVKDPNTDVQEATKTAYEQIVGSQYEIAKGPTSQVVVPRSLADKKIVESYLSVYSKKENFQDLNISVPTGYKDPNQYYEYLERQGRWVTSPDQSGMRLMQTLNNGKIQPVFDKYGKPVQKSFDEINRKPDQKVIDQDKGFLGRLFGG